MVRLPQVLIAHGDLELDINWRLDSIVSMQHLQGVRLNIKSVGRVVHFQELDWNS